MNSSKQEQMKPWTTPEARRFGSFTEATRNQGDKVFGTADGDVRQSDQAPLASA